MSDRQVLLYFAWSRPGETDAPLAVIEDRFPAIFELRRLFYPKFEAMSDPAQVDQGIAGFLDHIQKPNFMAFAEQAETQTGHPVIQVERVGDDGAATPLDEALIGHADTIVVISFDSFRTDQLASAAEIEAVRHFLSDPDHLIFVCPHHDIGEATELAGAERIERQTAEHLHHGDRGIPPRQGFGGFARTLLEGLGVPVENRFGLRPAVAPDGSPAPIEADRPLDALGLLREVEAFNLHAHLPQLERIGEAVSRMDVLARQLIDPTAPPHPAMPAGRTSFDALLQSRAEVFAGSCWYAIRPCSAPPPAVLDSLRRLWSNILSRPKRP
ncbi:MAG: hypothetical protein WDN69_31000, partial [Aliidongia sp.]